MPLPPSSKKASGPTDSAAKAEHAVPEAERRIRQAADRKATSLDLSGLRLTRLPESLGQLAQLQRLAVSNNRLRALPGWLRQLTQLHSLEVCYNQLTALPEPLGQLTQLQSLDVSANQLTALPDSLGQLTQLHSLEVCYNQLTALPESLGQLTQLQSLDVSGNHLKALPESLGQLTQLEGLNVSNNQLKALPESLGRLTQLRTLAVSANRLTALRESLARLTQLQSLNVRNNELTALLESLGQLTQLQSLDLSGNHLTALPDSLGQLTQLQSLDVSGNRLTALPEWLGQLTKLQSLDVSGNHLKALPESLGQLTQLQILIVCSNQLTALPESLGQLTQLQALDLSDNHLRALPESLRRLTGLKELYLHGNEALGLPPEVLGAHWAERPLKKPASPAAILDYYFRTRRGRRPLNEAKLILVGRGFVGKTCLIKRVIHGTFNEHEPETSGIEIQPWPVRVPDGDQVRLHVWDFGGQEILHATHQFFLTERTLYLLVLSGREGNPTQDAEYWLQLIRSFGLKSRVIIALNKTAQHPFDVNRGLLLEKYPFIADFVKTECKEPTQGLAELKALILRETGALEHRKADFPAEWFAIKERLAQMSEKNENFVTWEQYQEICRGLGEPDTKAQRDLAGFLHILGIALNYSDDPRLRDTHVLNPRWVTEGVYTLLRAGQENKRGGVLEKQDLGAVLKAEDYPASRHDFLLWLMEKFQLCFELKQDTGRYLVPELLGENQPEQIRPLLQEPGLGFRYQYEVLPEGLLPRFIVQTHPQSEAHPLLRWRTGVVLERAGCRAVVRADARERRVDIHIIGPERQRRDLLAVIREKFDEQHRDLKGLIVDERVPVPGEPGVSISYWHLRELEEDGEEEYRPEGMRKNVVVADLLNGVESPQSRAQRREREQYRSRQEPMPTIEVFYSYSHKDEELRDELEKHLSMLKRQGVIRGWHDRRITAGKEWAGQIDEHLNSAGVILLLVSADFLASDYCYDVEVKRAMERHEAGEAVVIPLILRSVDWQSAPFGKLQAFPKDARPVTSWTNQDEAFTDIAKGIRKAVEQLTNPR